jgi:acetoacetate decarboxylase
MLYAVDRRELRAWAQTGPFLASFREAEMLIVGFRTDPGVLGQLLPHPLEVPDDPQAVAFVGRYPETNFGVTYNEGALMVSAAFKGEPGWYCLSMPVDNDMAMIGGRERYGFPKKIADDITLDATDGRVVGRVVRRGEEILCLESDLTEEIGIDELAGFGGSPVDDLDGQPAVPVISFLFKHFPAADGSGFECAPRLIRQVTLFRPREGLRTGAAELTLGDAAADPLGEIPVLDVVAVAYGLFDNVMLPGRVIAKERNPLRFAPHAFFSTDTLAIVDVKDRPARSRRQRRKLRKRLARY